MDALPMDALPPDALPADALPNAVSPSLDGADAAADSGGLESETGSTAGGFAGGGASES
jgi:hypothetical protein